MGSSIEEEEAAEEPVVLTKAQKKRNKGKGKGKAKTQTAEDAEAQRLASVQKSQE